MDSNYIISRLRSSRYQYSTVDVLRSRLTNLDEKKRSEIVSRLKIELWKHNNVDIQESIRNLLYKKSMASVTF